nr:T9SS type A sorting domain-containing protein [Flavobacteriales bacterium]
QLPVFDVTCTGFFGLSNGQTVSSSTAVRVWLRNDGNQPATGFPIRYQQGQGAVVSQTFTGTLAVGEEELVTFNTAFVPNSDGEAPLCAWADLDTDLNADNDTTCVDLVTWVGVDELSIRSVEVLPNPARDQITMRGLPAGSLVLRIIDAQGRVVVDQQQRHGGGDLFVGLEGLAAGGYHVQARVNDQRFQARLVVQP